MRKLIRITLFVFVLAIGFTYRYQIYYFLKNHSSKKENILTKFESQTSSSNSFPYGNIKYLKNSNNLTIADDMVMTDQKEFDDFSHIYNDAISQRFSLSQINSIKEIVISDCEEFGEGECGLCRTSKTYSSSKTYTSSYILIATRKRDNIRNLLHECCHALYYDNIELFNKEFRDRWRNCTGFVSDYAETDIIEDFAETGSFYLSNATDSEEAPEKTLLFKEFYLRTK